MSKLLALLSTITLPCSALTLPPVRLPLPPGFASITLKTSASVPATPIYAPVDIAHVPIPTSVPTVSGGPWSWWYFDLTSPAFESFRVVYFAGPGFGDGLSPYSYWAQIAGTFKNGTIFNVIDASPNVIGTVKQSTGNFSNGDWGELGSWTSTVSDGIATYVAKFSSITTDFKSQLTLKQAAPEAYSCPECSSPSFDNSVPKQNIFAPGVGWDVALPGASASLSFTYRGQSFQFTGTGYHDSNFGMQPIPATTQNWLWGRASVGPYSIVYFADRAKGQNVALDNPSAWYTSGYIAKDGKKLVNFCSKEQTAANHNKTYIRIINQGKIWTAEPTYVGSFQTDPTSSTIYFFDGVDQYTFNFIKKYQQLAGVMPVLPYANWIASTSGGKNGENYTGVGMQEILQYTN